MDDLIARANKLAKSAGRTGMGQYAAAEKTMRSAKLLGWGSTALSAIVGTSIFAQWIESYPVIFGLGAVLAATLSAIQRTSKLDDRSESHRVAGSEYGRLRRRADMLRLRLEGKDVTREEGLAELDQIGDELSNLARDYRALPDAIYFPAKDKFDETHPEYA